MKNVRYTVRREIQVVRETSVGGWISYKIIVHCKEWPYKKKLQLHSLRYQMVYQYFCTISTFGSNCFLSKSTVLQGHESTVQSNVWWY
jgi:hypothetical protein